MSEASFCQDFQVLNNTLAELADVLRNEPDDLIRASVLEAVLARWSTMMDTPGLQRDGDDSQSDSVSSKLSSRQKKRRARRRTSSSIVRSPRISIDAKTAFCPGCGAVVAIMPDMIEHHEHDLVRDFFTL